MLIAAKLAWMCIWCCAALWERMAPPAVWSDWFGFVIAADAVNNAAGYGFSGVDERGAFRWDLLSNLNIWNIEVR